MIGNHQTASTDTAPTGRALAYSSFRDLDLARSHWLALLPFMADRLNPILGDLRVDWSHQTRVFKSEDVTRDQVQACLLGYPEAPIGDDRLERVLGHDCATRRVRAMALRGDIPTVGDLLELHHIMLLGRQVTNVGESNVFTGEVPSHVSTNQRPDWFTQAEKTLAELEVLFDWLGEVVTRGNRHVMVIAAEFHHRFTLIRPFAKGNGRLARLMVNYLLLRAGYLPMIVGCECRATYHSALRAADAGDRSRLELFLAERAEFTLRQAILQARTYARSHHELLAENQYHER